MDFKENQSGPHHYTTYQVAQLLGVDMTTIIGWCRQKKIKAYRTPGGHRRINASDLVSFLREYKMPVPAQLEQFSRFKCLVVDDEPAARIVVSRVVKQMEPNAEVDMAVDGFEAGRKVVEFRPHLVILDINLPGIDGLKVCRKIKKDEALKKIKILAVTGMTTPDIEKEARAAGADDFLAKPFGVADLKASIQKMIGLEPE